MLEKLDFHLDWSAQIEEIAGPFDGNRKHWIARAANRAGISCRKAKALFYGECSNPDFDIAYSVLSAAAKARAEASELATKFETAAGALNAEDSNRHRHDILALIDAARRLRGGSRS